MTAVLLFAEHELTDREVSRTLDALAELRGDGEDPVDVTVLVPYAAHWPVALVDELAAARGAPAARALDDARHDAAAAVGSERRIMRHVLSAVRGGGHRARGELVALRDVVRDLVAEAVVRRATTVLVVASPHPLSHLLHRDLEHRLRRAGVAQVVRLRDVDATVET